MSKQKQPTDITGDSILCTPKPQASSTVHRMHKSKVIQLKKMPINYSSEIDADSLGILSLDSLKLGSVLNSSEAESDKSRVTNTKLQQQRLLASNVLQKSTNEYKLPSRYLKASDSRASISSTISDSTVDEADLLKTAAFTKSQLKNIVEETSFLPNEMSTPRSSCVSDESDSPKTPLNRISSSAISKNLEELSHKIRNSDMSLAQLCQEFTKHNDFSLSQNISMDSELFVSGEQAIAKIAQQEESWRKHYGVLGGVSIQRDSTFSQLAADSLAAGDGTSVSTFFKKKSELADLCFKKSPEKKPPMPLIDKSLTYDSLMQSYNMKSSTNECLGSESVDESTLSLTEMEKAISSSDDTAKIMDFVFGKQNKAKASKMKSTNKPKDSYKRVSAIGQNKTDNFKENESCESSTDNFTVHSSSTEPLKDSRNNWSDKSSTSIRTASSLESLPDGKLPIECNKIELVWGCVPVGKRKTQVFILRNRSQNKLRLQLSSSSLNFKILNDHSEIDSVQTLPLLLYPSESRSFSIMFAPTTAGAFGEIISFSPVSKELQQKQIKRQQLHLFGYGGYAKVEIQNIPKDINMKMWLSLGKLENASELRQKFTVKNKGSVAGFAYFTFGSRALCGYSNVKIYPTELVLKPKEENGVEIIYMPSKDDLKHAFTMSNSQVIEIGYIQIITGEESLRGRIRRLCRKLKQEGGSISNPLIENLSKAFPNEKIPADLHKICETVGSMKELLQSLKSQEIALTIERDCERSLMGQIAGIDGTSMFHSLGEGMFTVLSNSMVTSSCTIEPSNVLLMPPAKVKDNVVLISQTAKALQFQTTSTNAQLLEISPREGILGPNETVLLSITCDVRRFNKQQPQQTYKMSIYVDDEVFEVDVKVILVNSKGLK